MIKAPKIKICTRCGKQFTTYSKLKICHNCQSGSMYHFNLNPPRHKIKIKGAVIHSIKI